MKIKLSEKARDVIKVVAPGLGAALGGPLGGLAGQILGGLVSGGDPADLEKVILEQKPETLMALRAADQAFEVKLQELGVERERISMADRASARDMAKVDMRPQMWLSALFLGGYFLLLLALMTGSIVIEGVAAEQFPTLMGVLTTGVPIILAFWFGSTAGSQSKTRMLYESKPAD